MNALVPAPNVPRIARLSVEDFMLLHDSGALDRYAKSELIEGEFFCMNSQCSRHARAKSLLAKRLFEAIERQGLAFEVWTEVSVQLSDDSMPGPDIVVTDYRGDKAIPLENVALIVEVADTTLDMDLGRKAAIYARGPVAENWVLDVTHQRLLVHTRPESGTFADRTEYPLGVAVSARTLPGVEVATSGLVD